MTLTTREKAAIIVSHLIAVYSEQANEGKIPQNQSVIDFILKNTPELYRAELSMDLIDDVFSFLSSQSMELS